jgi:hypothetical protein
LWLLLTPSSLVVQCLTCSESTPFCPEHFEKKRLEESSGGKEEGMWTSLRPYHCETLHREASNDDEGFNAVLKKIAQELLAIGKFCRMFVRRETLALFFFGGRRGGGGVTGMNRLESLDALGQQLVSSCARN